jgi:hypothetical protein
MKNIYVNGCSFSKGHPPLLDRNGKVWPDHLKDDYNVINESLSGGSSVRSLRMCISKALEQNTTLKDGKMVVQDSSIDTIICQLSSPERGEIWINEMGDYLAYIPNRYVLEDMLPKLNKMGIGLIRDDNNPETITDQNGRPIEEIYNLKIVHHVRNELTTYDDIQLQLASLCNTLQIVCNAVGIKLLLCAMSDRCIPGWEGAGNPYKIGTPRLPIPYFVKPFSQIFVHPSMVESDTDAHPNEEGHRIIYRYILSELKRL